jgi:hypothetical protein
MISSLNDDLFPDLNFLIRKTRFVAQPPRSYLPITLNQTHQVTVSQSVFPNNSGLKFLRLLLSAQAALLITWSSREILFPIHMNKEVLRRISIRLLRQVQFSVQPVEDERCDESNDRWHCKSPDQVRILDNLGCSERDGGGDGSHE